MFPFVVDPLSLWTECRSNHIGLPSSPSDNEFTASDPVSAQQNSANTLHRQLEEEEGFGTDSRLQVLGWKRLDKILHFCSGASTCPSSDYFEFRQLCNVRIKPDIHKRDTRGICAKKQSEKKWGFVTYLERRKIPFEFLGGAKYRLLTQG
ncbi:hypothetical protein H671_2g7552 [Cricetulus griseus]|nr:hypothetical protein H671_2g7552 [Cricetulus griseus]